MTTWHDLPSEVKSLILKAYLTVHIEAKAKLCLMYSKGSIKYRSSQYKWWSAVKTFLLVVPALYDEALVILRLLKHETEDELAALRKDSRLKLGPHSMGWFLACSRMHDAGAELALIADLYEELMDGQVRVNVEWCLTAQAQSLVDEICEIECE